MTPRQAAYSVAGMASFGLVIGLLFVGQHYLEKSRIGSAGMQATSLQEPPLPVPVPAAPAPPSVSGPTVATMAATGSAMTGNAGGGTTDDGVMLLLRESFQLLQQKRYDDALVKVNEALKVAPENANACELRGSIYAATSHWDEATKDYQRVLQLSGKNVQVEFDLAELNFMQKKYDAARPGFAALTQDPDTGDLAAYKVFLCDLWGGHDERAAQELDAFNKVGANPSYYFANGASLLYHHQTEEARGWLASAANIYAPGKFRLYAASLISEGYMPLPPASN